MMKRHASGAAALVLALLSGCRGSTSDDPVAVRLVDLFARQKPSSQAPSALPASPMSEWRFAAAPASAGRAHLGWEAGPGVAELTVRNGRLAGRSSDDFPVLHCERTAGLDQRDLLHSVEVRMSASAGSNLAVQFVGAEEVDLGEAVGQGRMVPWRVATPIVAGGDVRTYVLSAASNPFPIPAASVRHILIRPTDAADATFEIESIRLVFRKDFLAGIPAGVSWQGLSEVYRETLVAHAPEAVSLEVDVPRDAFLDLAVGTLETEPVTFRVAVREGRGEETVALERMVSKPEAWEPAPVDLSEWGGRRVALTLTLQAKRPDALGFWGSPVVRRRVAAAGERDGEAGRPRGVILILADTLRQDHLDVYGEPRETAPVLRRMAKEGALFRHAFAEGTWTKVSAPALLTSRYPLSTGVLDFEDRLPSSAVTLAEAFRDAGYATLNLSSIIFTGRFSNLHQGFEELHEASSLADRRSSKTAKEYVDRLVPWLERHRDVPFFVLLHLLDPHDPYEPKPPYNGKWADPARKEEHEKRTLAVRERIADPLLQAFGMPSRGEVTAAGFDPETFIGYEKDWYDGAILGMDTEIGRLLRELRRLGLERDVLVAFASDHGEEFFDHGRTSHGQTVYGELTNVPLIFWGAGVKPGRVVDSTVQNLDVMPTLLEASGVPLPAGLDGRSLLAHLAGSGLGGRERPAFAVKAATRDFFGPRPRETESLAVWSGGWKLIHNVQRPQGKPEFELYDFRQDPLDQRDVAAQHPDVVRSLAGLLAGWRPRAESRRLPSDAEAARTLGSKELERLRSLGYIR
ncbi:MAG TPA: sulfatase [Thermoanaerobaculia bacterium]|jgi:arylsulfatase A-like enzyme|nr:sulfatase [Thermoanaerobaculia bacterium]